MATKTKNTDLKKFEDLVHSLFDGMMIKSEFSVEEDKDNEAFVLNIKAEDEAGLLIGSRGKTLLSIQTVLAQMLRQQLGNWKRVIVNVADWREKEEERLKELAKQTAERAVASGEDQYLYNLTPSQRRLVHMALSEEEDVNTESQGEGNDRYLIVSPKK